MSLFSGNGSHLAEADAAEGHAGQVDGPGSSGNTGIGSHLEATDAADGHAGQVASSGMSGLSIFANKRSLVYARWSLKMKDLRVLSQLAIIRSFVP